MSLYREEADPVDEPELVDVKRERLAHLERCEQVLEVLEDHAFYIQEPSYFGPRKWRIALEDVFEVHGRGTGEGQGRTLMQAVENAMGWGRVPKYKPPEPEHKPAWWGAARFVIIIFGLGVLVGVGWRAW